MWCWILGCFAAFGTVRGERHKKAPPRQAALQLRWAAEGLRGALRGAGARAAEPLRLLRRAAVGEVSLGGGGGRNFTALIDTGSGNLVVASSRCRSLGCGRHRRFALEDDEAGRMVAVNASSEVELAYAGARIAGNGFESRVCLGGACGRASFVVAAFESDSFRDLGFDAILGLGPPRQALAPGFNVLGALAGQGVLPSASFMLSLRPDGSSSVVLGDGALPAAGRSPAGAPPQMWLPVDRRHGEWAVHLEDVLVDDKRTNACPNAGCRAILDTGCPNLVLPANALARLRVHLPLDGCSPAAVAALPSLRLAWGQGGREHEVRPEHYVDISEDDPPRCRVLVAAADDFGARTAVLGLPFFLGRDVAFDQERLRVGLAGGAPPARPAERSAPAGAGWGPALGAFLGG